MSRQREEPISGVTVTHIASNGICLLAHDREMFLSYADFPWFKNATVTEVLRVEEPGPGHFYWPELDVDLDIDSIEDPERFPLKARE